MGLRLRIFRRLRLSFRVLAPEQSGKTGGHALYLRLRCVTELADAFIKLTPKTVHAGTKPAHSVAELLAKNARDLCGTFPDLLPAFRKIGAFFRRRTA